MFLPWSPPRAPQLTLLLEIVDRADSEAGASQARDSAPYASQIGAHHPEPVHRVAPARALKGGWTVRGAKRFLSILRWSAQGYVFTGTFFATGAGSSY